MFLLYGDIFRRLGVPCYSSSFVYGVVPYLADKRHDLANFACAQAKMAVYRTRKKMLQGDTDGCSVELPVFRDLLKARLRLEHAMYHTHIGDVQRVFFERWGARKPPLCTSVDGTLVFTF
ncbi:unnamed protein product [Lampetra fluviatilis]